MLISMLIKLLLQASPATISLPLLNGPEHKKKYKNA